MARSQKRDKAKLLKALAEMPIIVVACKMVDVPRPTFYRWMKEDDEFREQVSEAIRQGDDVMIGLAESKLVNRVKDEDMSAIKFVLNNRSDRYGFPKRTLDKKPGLIERAVQIFDMRSGKKKKLIDDDD